MLTIGDLSSVIVTANESRDCWGDVTIVVILIKTLDCDLNEAGARATPTRQIARLVSSSEFSLVILSRFPTTFFIRRARSL